MKLKQSVAILLACCAFILSGCQNAKQSNDSDDQKIPQALLKAIKQKYPNSVIKDYDKDSAGSEVDITDQNKQKELLFDAKNQWISTKWNIHADDVPTVVMDNLSSSAYHEYVIKEIYEVERSSGTYFVFELKQNNNEVHLTFNAEGQLIAPQI